MKARAVLVRLHRYAGLTTAAFLFVAGLTGSVIAFNGELDAWLNPDLYRATVQGPQLSPSELAARVERALPEAQVTYLPFDQPRGEAAVVRVAGQDGRTLDYDQVFADPVTGRILGMRQWGACCFSRRHIVPFLYLTHYSLSVPGVWGVLLMGIVSLIWAADCFVGFVLTLPRAGPFFRKWQPSWTVKTGASGYRINVDVHRAAGLWLWGVLFVVALSGVALNLPDQVFRPLVSVFSNLKPTALDLAAARLRAKPLPARVSFDQAVARAQAGARARHRPFHLIGIVHYPEYGAYGVGFAAPGENGRDGMGSSWIYLDDRTGGLLTADITGTGSTGDVFLQAQFPLHSGRIIGLAGRILIAITGLAVAILSLTGVLIWLKKHLAATVHRKRLAARPAPLAEAASGI